MCGPYSATTIQNGFILMLILTILLSLALAAAFTLLPAGIHHRRPARADLYAGAGVSALVWLWAVCVWSKSRSGL